MRVTLIEWPSPISWRTAGTPASVPGTLTSRFGLAIRRCSAWAALTVPAVSLASEGATSKETNPSAPPLLARTGPMTSSASVMSRTTSSQ